MELSPSLIRNDFCTFAKINGRKQHNQKRATATVLLMGLGLGSGGGEGGGGGGGGGSGPRIKFKRGLFLIRYQ